jgi:hypothetical protein
MNIDGALNLQSRKREVQTLLSVRQKVLSWSQRTHCRKVIGDCTTPIRQAAHVYIDGHMYNYRYNPEKTRKPTPIQYVTQHS